MRGSAGTAEKVDLGRKFGQSRRAMVDSRKNKGGRPVNPFARTKNVSFRVRPEFAEALERLAKKEHRRAFDQARVVIGKVLIDAKLLPPDFDF